jgi:RNA polymerase sigma-70 factor (ECF subfamily)
MASSLTDAIVEEARRGDSAALTALYESVAPGILAYLRGRGSADPEALTQDVFLQLLPRIRRIKGGARGVQALAYTIAHSRLVDELRRRGRSLETSVAEPIDTDSHSSAEDEVLNGAERALSLLASLGEAQRTVIMLRIFGDLSVEQTARVLGKSVGAVKQLQRRGLLALRDTLTDSGETP